MQKWLKKKATTYIPENTVLLSFNRFEVVPMFSSTQALLRDETGAWPVHVEQQLLLWTTLHGTILRSTFLGQTCAISASSLHLSSQRASFLRLSFEGSLNKTQRSTLSFIKLYDTSSIICLLLLLLLESVFNCAHPAGGFQPIRKQDEQQWPWPQRKYHTIMCMHIHICVH